MARRGVFKPPYGSASSLLSWGVDLWPYVNGKALVNGLQLASMEASDMLDVLHYFLEDDFRYSSEYEPLYKDNFRKNIYNSFYGVEYKYMSNEEEEKDLSNDSMNGLDGPEEPLEPEEIIEPFNPRKASVKPYIEPTQVADGELPFGSILDQPMGF